MLTLLSMPIAVMLSCGSNAVMENVVPRVAATLCAVNCGVANLQDARPLDDGVDPPRKLVRVVSTEQEDAQANEAQKLQAGESEEEEGVTAANIPTGGPWLGIQFAPMPDALAAHLNTKSGMILLNIAKGSPSDVAGLKQYDVILAIGGRELTSKLEDVLNATRDLAVGQPTEFKIIRGGKPMTVSLTVGSRPEDVSKVEYKYEMAKEAASAQVQTVIPQVFSLKNGQLLAPDADAYKDLQALMPLLRERRSLDALKNIKGAKKSFVIIRQSEDGQTVEIKNEDEGKIKVTRTDKDGDQTSSTFASEEELKASDPDAHKIYEEWRTGNDNGPWWRNDAKGFGPGAWRDDDFQRRMQDAMDSFFKNWESTQPSARDSQNARKQFHTRMKELFDESAIQRTPGTSFRTRADGTIEIVTRDGNDEMVEIFKDEGAMKKARPDMYERYSRLRSAQKDPNRN